MDHHGIERHRRGFGIEPGTGERQVIQIVCVGQNIGVTCIEAHSCRCGARRFQRCFQCAQRIGTADRRMGGVVTAQIPSRRAVGYRRFCPKPSGGIGEIRAYIVGVSFRRSEIRNGIAGVVEKTGHGIVAAALHQHAVEIMGAIGLFGKAVSAAVDELKTAIGIQVPAGGLQPFAECGQLLGTAQLPG